jgi:peptidoglycan/xylan/chitin deacetylase (PgdA/CDA1 family)
VLAVAAAAIVFLAVRSNKNTSTATAGTTSTVKRNPAGKTQHARKVVQKAPAPVSREDRAIRSVLAYTPFIRDGVPRHRMIALTFDDGPSPYTPQIVNTLVKAHVPATFFVVGQQLNDFADGLRDELRHGFAIGDHTENHAWLTHYSPGGQFAQVHDAAARMEHLGAPAPVLFRPPYGVYDSTTLATLKRFHMLMVMWSIDPGDWRRPGTGAIVSNVLANSKPGAIVIMHDGGGDRSQTVAALPAIISGLRKRGYQLVTVPQLVAADPPPRGQPLPHMSAA